MRQATEQLEVKTGGKGLTDITRRVSTWVLEQGMSTGLLSVFIKHTSASLTIQENADPAVLVDLEDFMARTAPESTTMYEHSSEGPDDMPAHIRSVISGVNLSIPLVDGRLSLGTWQGVYVWEHRSRPHSRNVVLHLAGE